MTEALPLLALLQQTSGRHDKDNVNTNHAEDRSKNVVDQDVGEGDDGGRTWAHERGGGWARADVVGDEGGGGAIEVAAAFELEFLLA